MAFLRLAVVALLVAPTDCWAHGWRDQFVRVSAKLQTALSGKARRARALQSTNSSWEVPSHMKQAARDAIKSAERVYHAHRHNERQRSKPEHERRKLMDVDCSGRTCTVNGVTLSDMSLFDCPWVGSLHPYLNPSAAFGVDGGLCLPYQEIPFPYSIGLDPVDTTAANIVCPSSDSAWDAFTATCANGVGTCMYPGDSENFGGATGVAENYGCAAANPGWPSSSAAALSTPLCKTYVHDCTYSKKPTRKYTYGANAAITEPGQGYDINWVLSEVAPLRNSLGAHDVMNDDLLAAGVPPAPGIWDPPSLNWSFPSLYDFFYDVAAGSKPPTTGHYPHAFVKGYFNGDHVDTSRDGECDVNDARTQWMDCGIPCPVGDEARMSGGDMGGFAAAVLVFIILCALCGAAAFFLVGGSSEKFFVGGRTLNVFVITATLASQSLDSNAALGNIDLGYKYHWWDGACLPIGLGLSLFLNGLFFAKPLNEMKLLTLPDVFARTFGPAVECLFTVLAIISFLCLLAGNLVGTGNIISFVFDIKDSDGAVDPVAGIWICTFAVWLYTVSGGLISVAFTDCGQALVGWLGLVVGTGWVMNNMPTAAGISPAYPIGDVTNTAAQMGDPDALDPIPNAIVFNWVTIFVLGFGNLAALDFQARVMAAKTPTTARIGCIAGAIISWVVGILFSYCSGAARALYGPSSPYAEFVSDSCSQEITIIGCFGDGCQATVLPGVPTCGEWKPDKFAPLRMFTCTKPDCHYIFDFDGSAGIGALSEGNFPMNGFIGGWVLVSICAASMSTGDGAILAMSTTFAHNILRKVAPSKFQDGRSLLIAARLATILWAPLAAAIASAVPGETGYLLVVAFDIMLAGSVVPLFAAVYWKSCKPIAAFIAMLGGSLLRFILEYSLPKDGLLLLVGSFGKSFGPGSYAGLNVETGMPFPDWCPQFKLKDFTGVDSLIAPAFSLVLLLVCQLIPSPEHKWFTPVPAEDCADSSTIHVAPVDPAPVEQPREGTL